MYVLENSQVKYCKILAQYYFLWNVIYELVTTIILSPRLSTGTRTAPLSQILYFNSLMLVATYVQRIFVRIRIGMSGVIFLSSNYITIYSDVW